MGALLRLASFPSLPSLMLDALKRAIRRRLLRDPGYAFLFEPPPT